MEEADKIHVQIERSRIVKDSLEEIKMKLLGKVLSKGDTIGALKVHDIAPNKSQVTQNTKITFESDLKKCP